MVLRLATWFSQTEVRETYLDTLALGKRDPGLLLANDEDVGFTGGERVVNSVLDVDNVETTVVALTVGDDTNTTHVTTTSGHDNNTGIETDVVGDLASGKVNLHGVVDLDIRVGVADAILQTPLAQTVPFFHGLTNPSKREISSSYPPPINQSLVQRLNDTELVESRHSRSRIVRNQEWDPALAELHTLDLAQLVFGLLSLDAVDGETALGVVDQAEVLASLLDADDVHETGRVVDVGADLAVDLDQALHHDRLGLTAVKGVLQTADHKVSESFPALLQLFSDWLFRTGYG